MVTFLFTAIFIIGFLAVGLYFWQRTAPSTGRGLLPPLHPPRGLFSEQDGLESAWPSASALIENERQRASLVERARDADNSTLSEAQALGDREFYNEILNLLAADTDSDSRLLALVSYVTRNELPVNKALAEAVIKSWRSSPGRGSTATTLHITALADDAQLYQSTVEAALRFWREGKVADISAAELRALFDGEFWVLSTQTRSSGAGFVLKRTLASARRELESTARVNK
jgi:hypothetical protein